VVTFTDELTRYSYVAFCQRKSQVKERFVEFLNWVKLQGHRVRLLNSDGGGEYTSNENAHVASDFSKICKAHDIEQQFTSAYTPSQNGIAERLNRTLVEHASCLLHEAGLAKEFWSFAVKHVAWAHNLIRAGLQRGKHTPSALCVRVRVVMCSTPGVKHGEQVAQDKQVAGGGGGDVDTKHVKHSQLCFMHVAKCIESKHGAFPFVPGFPNMKLKISRAESRNVTEPKETTPRRTARTVHPNAVQIKEALRIASVCAKLSSSSPVHPVDCGVERRLTVMIRSWPISVEFAAGTLFFSQLNMGPPDISEPCCYP